MKVLFVHDGPIFVDPIGNYYANFIDDSILLRYLHLGTSLSILTRVVKLPANESKNFAKINSTDFNVIQIPDYKSVIGFFTKQPEALSIINKAVQFHDIIIARLPSSSPAHALKRAKKMGKPVLAEVVACSWDVLTNHSLLGKIMAPWYSYKLWRNARSLTHSIYVTQHFLQSRYPTRGKYLGCSDVLLNENDDEVLTKRLERTKQRSEEEMLVVGTIGTLDVVYKGQLDVLMALYKLKKKGKRVVYKLVGQGSPARLKQAVKEYQLEKEVEIIGPINHDKIFEFIDSLDLYIHPSRTEGLPRAPIEAMSRACPVIGSNAGGTPELLNRHTMFEKGNVSQIMELLTTIDKDFLLREASIVYNRSKQYGSSQLALKRFKFYKEFLLDHNLPILSKLNSQINKLSTN